MIKYGYGKIADLCGPKVRVRACLHRQQLAYMVFFPLDIKVSLEKIKINPICRLEKNEVK